MTATLGKSKEQHTPSEPSELTRLSECVHILGVLAEFEVLGIVGMYTSSTVQGGGGSFRIGNL